MAALNGKSTTSENLLAQAGQRSAQLAAQLRADAAALGFPELTSAADALSHCAGAAQKLAELLTDRKEMTE